MDVQARTKMSLLVVVRGKVTDMVSIVRVMIRNGKGIGVTADFISPLRIPAGVQCERPPLFYRGAHI